MEKHSKHWEKSQNSKLKLMHAAQGLFLERGFTEVSVNDICEQAGMTKGAFYHHFSSKEEMYRQLLVPSLDEYIDEHYHADAMSSTEQRLKCAATLSRLHQ